MTKLLQAPAPLLVLTLSMIWLLVFHAAAQEPVFILGNDICPLKVLFFTFGHCLADRCRNVIFTDD